MKLIVYYLSDGLPQSDSLTYMYLLYNIPQNMFATVQLKIQKILQGCWKYRNFTWMEKKLKF